ncbi:double-stranded RNA-binding motif protein, partial [Trifolium medium]|nr:double-stranded RNA-binding motif protein [Trifolium medium]
MSCQCQIPYIRHVFNLKCGLHMYAAFSSPIKENEAEQSTHESDIVKSKQKLNPEDEVLVDKEILPTN